MRRAERFLLLLALFGFVVAGGSSHVSGQIDSIYLRLGGLPMGEGLIVDPEGNN